MRKRINLLKTRKKFKDKENLYAQIRNTLIILFLIFTLSNFVIYYFLAGQNRLVNRLTAEKTELVQFFIDNKEAEAEFVYFSNKQRQLSDVLREDVNFYPYYNLLKESLDKFAFASKLESVFIDKDKSVKFTVTFDDYTNLLSFLKFAESDDFLANFDKLSLINFSTTDTNTFRKEYRLNFIGKFTLIE